jgi:glutathione S-transferase
VLIYPCPKGSKHHWDRLTALGGKSQVPFLYDPNTSRYLYDARQIIDYLFQTYMPEKTLRAPQNLGLRQSQLATALRLKAGLKAHQNSSAAKAVVQPLELFSFEASPFSRLVREKLSELSLAYVLKTLASNNLQTKGYHGFAPI